MDFDSAAFIASTPEERVALCNAFAAEAGVLVEKAAGSNRESYAALARAWAALAVQIETSKESAKG